MLIRYKKPFRGNQAKLSFPATVKVEVLVSKNGKKKTPNFKGNSQV